VKLLVSWLRDFVDVPVPPDELGRMLSMRGFELAGIEPAPPPASSEDAIVDVEITPNRPDCLGVIGLAREVATTFDRPLRELSRNRPAPLSLATLDVGANERVRVLLEDPALCPRYAAAVAEVTVGPSPAWLVARLHAAGIRPINNVVDITNYVLMELGQPMHAFDLAKLAGSEIRIRRARAGEKVRTLDGTERALTPDMLVIADGARPQAIAGVMGGADSEVSQSTRLVVFESANFDAKSVRITSRKIGLKTEAAARFERGADVGAPVTGIERACALLEATGAGRALGSVVDCYPTPAPRRQIRLRQARIARVLGETIVPALVERFLTGLGFQASKTGDSWDVVVPTFRVDIIRETDLIEEVARHYGYDKLPVTFPALQTPPEAPLPSLNRDRRAREMLLRAGFTEAVTFSFIEKQAAGLFAADAELVPVANPLSEKFSTLRPSLLPGLLESVRHNRHHQVRDVRLFEVGRCFTRSGGEQSNVAFVWTGAARADHWSTDVVPVSFFDAKAVADVLIRAFKVTKPTVERVQIPYMIPGRTAQVVGTPTNGAESPSKTRQVGYLGELAPAVMRALDLPESDPVFVGEFDLGALASFTSDVESRRVESLPRFPSIVRDISIIVDEYLPAANVRGTIRSAAPATLAGVHEFDRYQGKGIPEGRISLSLRLTFQSPERTLTDAEVQQAMEAILGALVKDHGAVQR
jgi:phenylalanyl-tRNA synthetase beta chain